MPVVLARPAPAARELVASFVLARSADGRHGHLRFQLLLGEGLLAGELDLAHRIDGDDFDGDLVAFLDDVGGLAHAVGSELRDVHQPVLAGQDLDEGSVRLDPAHLAAVDLADLRLLREALDDLDGLQGRRLVGGCDGDLAGILDVDLAPGGFDDGADGLASRADDVADAIARNLHGEDPGRVTGDVRPRPVEGRGHVLEDVEPPDARLLQGPLDDLPLEPLDLDVHLESGDAFAGPGDLEVHVAVVV